MGQQRRPERAAARPANRFRGGGLPGAGLPLAAAALLGLAGSVSAQPRQPPGRSASVLIRAGGYLPADDLYGGVLRTDVLPPRVAIGVAFENDLGASPISLRVTLDAVPSYSVSVRLVCPEDQAGGCPQSDRIRYRLGIASADLVVRLPGPGRSVPYLHAGPAVKGYVREDPWSDVLEPALRFGGGVELELAGRRISFEVNDSISWFAPNRDSTAEVQHDVVVAAGLRLDP